MTQEGAGNIRVFLKYDDKESSVIHGIERVSTPAAEYI